MKPPPCPVDESARLRTLRSLNILDSPSEERFERITRLARRLFDMPIALISLVDENRQWFKSHPGLEMTETPRDVSFCGHTIIGDHIMEVRDTRADERFHDNPLVTQSPQIRLYAGCPLTAPDGSRLGALCLMDQAPRSLSPEDHALLRDLTDMAAQEISALQLATTDELTGLSNRRGFIGLAQQVLAMCRRAGRAACLSFFDIDGLKNVNDRFGHASGDELIRDFGTVLLQVFRDSDVVARLGGDEFVVMMSYCSDAADAIQQRLQRMVDERNTALPEERRIRFSVGTVTIEPASSRTVDEWLHQADALMYQRKREKRAAS